jgi:putative Mn2+ efflux pump MntP
MDFITVVLIAVGLSFDTFAVSVSAGLSINNIRFWQAIKISLILAFFQALMPLIGWFLGSQIERLIRDYDHWVAFGLLLILGLKMIIESFKIATKEDKIIFPKLSVIIGMAIATSIDALVVGVSFAFISTNIFLSVLIIGFITFLVAMTGMLFGKTVGNKLGNKMEIIGGLILISIGLKTLIGHL